MTSVQKKWLYRALIMLIFIFAFGIRVHHLSEKKGFHCDEVMSISISGYQGYGWEKHIPEGEYTGAQIKNMVFNIDERAKEQVDSYRFLNVLPLGASDSPIRDLANDIFCLWDNNRDTPHSNFYYTLLRLSLFGVDSADSAEFESKYIFRAGLLNLLLFTLSFVAFFILLNLMIKDRILILLGLIVAFLNLSEISNALFFRPYSLQSLFVIIFISSLIRISQKLTLGEYKDSSRNLFLFALPLSLMLLTGYYFFVYAFVVGMFFIIFPLRKTGNLRLISFFFYGSILAFLLDLLWYNNFTAGFYSYRALHSLSFYKKSMSFFDCIFNAIALLNDYLFYTVALIILSVGVFYKIIKKNSFDLWTEYGWIPVASLVFFVILLVIAPSASPLRFVSASIVIISLLYPILLAAINNVIIKRVISVLIAFVFIFILIKGDGVMYKFDNIRTYSSELADLGSQDDELPVYIHIGMPSFLALLVQRLEDDKKYTFCYDTKFLLEQKQRKNFFIYFSRGVDEDFAISSFDSKIDFTQHGFELAFIDKGTGLRIYKTN